MVLVAEKFCVAVQEPTGPPCQLPSSCDTSAGVLEAAPDRARGYELQDARLQDLSLHTFTLSACKRLITVFTSPRLAHRSWHDWLPDGMPQESEHWQQMRCGQRHRFLCRPLQMPEQQGPLPPPQLSPLARQTAAASSVTSPVSARAVSSPSAVRRVVCWPTAMAK